MSTHYFQLGNVNVEIDKKTDGTFGVFVNSSDLDVCVPEGTLAKLLTASNIASDNVYVGYDTESFVLSATEAVAFIFALMGMESSHVEK